MSRIEIAAAIVFVLTVGILFGYGKGYYSGVETTKAAWNKERLQEEQKTQQVLKEYREKEQLWQDNAQKLQEKKINEVRNINARHAAALNSLRQRPERASITSTMPETAVTCSGSTGKELARGDAEFLAGYAADAAKLQEALNQCVAQYNQLR